MAAGALALDRTVRARLEPLVLAALASVGPALALIGAYVIGLRGWFNDFHVYYLAGRLVAEGRSPYDTAALGELGRSLGLDFVVGGGYSYPPPFAVAMVPLAALPFGVAVALFTAVSVVVFAATIAWWLRRVAPGEGAAAVRKRRLLALGSGLYPPVAGSVFAGQANLLVFGLLGAGLAPFIPGRATVVGRSRSLGSGVLVGLAGIVKIAPLALAAPVALATGRVRGASGALAGLTIGAVGSLALAVAIAPEARQGQGGLAELFGADPFWTNQSLNGAISRLFLSDARTAAIFTGIPAFPITEAAIWPWIVAATALLAAATVLVLLSAAPALANRGVLATALGLAIVAAAAGAPKNSFWNHAPVLLAVGLSIAGGDLLARRSARLLVGVWLVATVVEVLVDPLQGPVSGPLAPIRTLASDSAVVGLLALWLALALQLIRAAGVSIARPVVRRPPAGA